MKKKLTFIFIFALLVYKSYGSKIGKAENLFLTKDYLGALAAYEDLLRENPSDPNLNYNAGTSAIRAQNYGKSILYLERALKYDPSLKDAQVNLKIAIGKIGTVYIAEKPTIWEKLWKRIYSTYNSNEWLIIFMYFSIVLLLIQYFKPKLRRSQYVGYSYIIGFLAFLSLLSSYSIYKHSTDHDHVVFLRKSQTYKDPKLKQKMSTLLAPGQKGQALSQNQNKMLVKLPNGMTTYISSTDVERI